MMKFARFSQCGMMVAYEKGRGNLLFSGEADINTEQWVDDPVSLIKHGDYVRFRYCDDIIRYDSTIAMDQSKEIVAIYKESDGGNLYRLCHKNENGEWEIQ